MKSTYLLLGLLLFVQLAYAQNTLRVQVRPFSEPKGTAFIGLYNNATTFGKPEQVFLGKQVPVRTGQVECVFENVPNGTYAVAVFQDENGNQKLDKGMFGIPKEHYGFSNNVLPAMRQATFEEAQFTLTGQPVSIQIKLK